jgi:hypothetical protein
VGQEEDRPVKDQVFPMQKENLEAQWQCG